MNKFAILLTLTLAASSAAYASRPLSGPKIRVSPAHDHTPKLRIKGAVPHK